MRCFKKAGIFMAIIFTICLFCCELFEDNKDDTENTIRWTVKNSPYILEDTFIVEKNQMLIIEPGVIVAFMAGRKLKIRGKLIAEGTELDSITFTAYPDSSVIGYQDYWYGIELDTCNSETIFKYCRFEKYFGENQVIICNNSSPTFSHCEFMPPELLIESHGCIIRCINNSSPHIEYSRLTYWDYKGSCVACDEFCDFVNRSNSNPLIYHNDILLTMIVMQ